MIDDDRSWRVLPYSTNKTSRAARGACDLIVNLPRPGRTLLTVINLMLINQVLLTPELYPVPYRQQCTFRIRTYSEVLTCCTADHGGYKFIAYPRHILPHILTGRYYI
jgi:hypothetical protein